jgi:hypothetical protein
MFTLIKRYLFYKKYINDIKKPSLLKVFFRAKFGYEFIITDEKKNMQYAMVYAFVAMFFLTMLPWYLFKLISVYQRCTALCFNISAPWPDILLYNFTQIFIYKLYYQQDTE